MAERKTYTAEQKAEIIKRADETSVLAASKEFGVSRAAITAWKKAAELEAVKKATEKKVRSKVKAAAEEAKAEAKKAETTVKAEAKKTRGKAKAAVEDTKEKAKAATKSKPKAKKAEYILQSAFGHELVVEEIAAKIPDDVEKVYIRIDQNKLHFVRKDGSTGSVDIWE